MKNQPEEIYLNLGDNIDCLDYNELVENEIGWSKKPYTTNALRYVRTDLRDEDVINVSLRDHLVGLRDQIAIAYMQAQVQAGALYETWDDLSGDAYKMADAMLKERLIKEGVENERIKFV